MQKGSLPNVIKLEQPELPTCEVLAALSIYVPADIYEIVSLSGEVQAAENSTLRHPPYGFSLPLDCPVVIVSISPRNLKFLAQTMDFTIHYLTVSVKSPGDEISSSGDIR